MFCNKPKHSRNLPAKRNRKRKKKPCHPHSVKKTKCTHQSNLNLATMSSWAKSYNTVASTWQLKHQLAYWKARAKALEYENSVLHDTIRKNYFKNHEYRTKSTSSGEFESDGSSESNESDDEADESDESETGSDSEEDNDDLEVSEEFIEFLKKNAKYKEEVKREKERLEAMNEAENDKMLMEEMTSETSEEKQKRLIELYGDNWEQIMALETFTLCNFINECDKKRPKYWPNIPFNFGDYGAR